MSAAYVYDAVRVPFGRYGGALAKVRPDDLGAVVVKSIVERTGRRSRAHRRRHVRQRQRRRRGQPQRRAHGGAARRPADVRPRHHGQPAVRVEPRRRDPGEPRDRDRRRRRRARRRRGVDEPRAVGGAEAGEGLPGRSADDALDHARLAHGQPGHAGPVDDLARRVDREAGGHPRRRPGGAGRVRAAQPPARRRRRGTTASTTPGSSRCRTSTSRATRASARIRRWRSSPSSSPRSSRSTGRSRRATRHRSTTAPPPC